VPTVLITGAGRGLGYEFARQYAADGWKVIGTVRDARAKAALTKLGVDAPIADVTDSKSIAQLAEGLEDAPIDVLICNAGIYGPRHQTFGKLDYAAWDEVLRVNLFGPTAVAEALLENVAASERKVLVMMSSRLGSIAAEETISVSSRRARQPAGIVGRAGRCSVTVVSVRPAGCAPTWAERARRSRPKPRSAACARSSPACPRRNPAGFSAMTAPP
jgi:NAD(P)-dependent dehydrogenase (short-subunit alcohol dehydrogenase family)